ncbi:Y-family DNA polymerase [Psychroflexus aestuariivivens]|uniref:Y-family DNA polymerase n=1 Tax=Psychroflexus aestuariivivens TaxID=1795040 RepID=UPI000FD70E0A|nr:Y-family DNA polymerase [Psychroflexus aestuariivivens]
MFALVDCNNFYASCERVFNPDLRQKPVVILSNNDGCVIARSNEAKALGIPMGAPTYKYEKIFKQHNVNVFSSNYALYGDMSSRVMNILSTFTPDVEIYSIDEAFLEFIGFERFDMDSYCKKIKYTVEKSTGIPICIGLAPTKALSKVANRIAKKFQDKTGGIFIMKDDSARIKALKWLKIEDVWGIGRQHALRLKRYNITNAHQFSELPAEWVRKHMSVVGLRLQKELQGIKSLDLETPANKKAIATTRSFDKQYDDFEYVKERVSSFTIKCAEKLRKQGSCCQMIYVFLKTNKFRQDLPQYQNSIVVQVGYPTNSSIDLIKFAVLGLQEIFREGFHYKKAGVIVMGLVPENQRQLSFFSGENPKHSNLMQEIDRMNSFYGSGAVRFGSQDLGNLWKMRRERLSGGQIITIKG